VVVVDNQTVSPPPSSFGGFSPNLWFGLFFACRPVPGAARSKCFDPFAKFALEYQAFRGYPAQLSWLARVRAHD